MRRGFKAGKYLKVKKEPLLSRNAEFIKHRTEENKESGLPTKSHIEVNIQATMGI